MAIPNKQIGGSVNYNLLWQISKQLEQLICIRSGNCTTTTSTTVAPCVLFTNFTNESEEPVDIGVTGILCGDTTLRTYDLFPGNSICLQYFESAFPGGGGLNGTCTAPVLITTTFGYSFPVDYIKLDLTANGVICDTFNVGDITAEIYLSEVLNNSLGFLGTWEVDGIQVTLTTTQAILYQYCLNINLNGMYFWQDL